MVMYNEYGLDPEKKSSQTISPTFSFVLAPSLMPCTKYVLTLQILATLLQRVERKDTIQSHRKTTQRAVICTSACLLRKDSGRFEILFMKIRVIHSISEQSCQSIARHQHLLVKKH